MSFNFVVAVTNSSDFGVQESKVCHCFHCFPIYLHEVMELDAMILVFECWVLSLFHSPLSPSSRGSLVPLHFLSWGWCHLHIWGYWYFSWQSWFQFVLYSAWCFTRCTLHINTICSAYIYICVCVCVCVCVYIYIYIFTTVKQAEWQYTAWCSPFPIWNQSIFPCPILITASLSAYRFLRRQVRWSGTPISFRIFHSILWNMQ